MAFWDGKRSVFEVIVARILNGERTFKMSDARSSHKSSSIKISKSLNSQSISFGGLWELDNKEEILAAVKSFIARRLENAARFYKSSHPSEALDVDKMVDIALGKVDDSVVEKYLLTQTFVLLNRFNGIGDGLELIRKMYKAFEQCCNLAKVLGINFANAKLEDGDNLLHKIDKNSELIVSCIKQNVLSQQIFEMLKQSSGFTPIKYACLSDDKQPVKFLLNLLDELNQKQINEIIDNELKSNSAKLDELILLAKDADCGKVLEVLVDKISNQDQCLELLRPIQERNYQLDFLLTKRFFDLSGEKSKLYDLPFLSEQKNLDNILLTAACYKSQNQNSHNSSQQKVIELLLEKGASLLFEDRNGKNILAIIIDNKDFDLASGVLSNVYTKNQESACNLVKALSETGQNQIFKSAVTNKNFEAIKCLLDVDIKFTQTTKDDTNLFCRACS